MEEHDVTDKSSQALPVQQQQKKTRKSLTSFSIFRKDKKFSESTTVVATKAAPKPTRDNIALDNTRLEVGWWW